MSKNPAEMTDEELEQAENARAQEQSGTGDTTAFTETTTTDETTQTGETTEEAQTTETTSTATTEQTGQAGETTETTTTTEQAAAETTAGAETGKVAGVASKDGTRVLPYSALQAERRSARQNAARAERTEKENERLRQEIEDLRAGKSRDSGELTEEEVQRMEADFPDAGAKMRKAFEAQEQAKKVTAAAPKNEEVDDVDNDPAVVAQEAIDQVPLLVEWQHDPAHADKWQRAIEVDNVMRTSPKWKDKPPVNRFEHVAKMVAEEFDIEVPAKADTKQSSSKQPAAKAKPDPAKAAVDGAQRQPPSTLSDLKGGAIPDHGQVDFSKLPAPSMLNRYMDMTPEEMDRHLAKLG